MSIIYSGFFSYETLINLIFLQKSKMTHQNFGDQLPFYPWLRASCQTRYDDDSRAIVYLMSCYLVGSLKR